MNVLIIGSGGREHTLAWKISKSKLLTNLYIAPGNAGTNSAGVNVDIQVNDFEALGSFALESHINMIIVGPEEPLVNGIFEYFQNDLRLSHVAIIGPSKSGAMLEGSKDFAKEFMKRHSIPTASFKSITKDNVEEGYVFLENLSPPYVLKADGLAAGKGVLILHEINEAKKMLHEMLEGKFGNAGKTVVIEQFLKGIELSVFVLTDGNSYKILPEAKDYKRIGEGDTGLNTGGMGAVSPVPFANTDFLKKVENKIIIPTINGIKKENIGYLGFIFFGLINVEGEPYVIEYNVRMGDPEAEVVLPRVNTDILEVFNAIAQKELDKIELDISPDTVSTVVLVSGGYPGQYEKGFLIENLDEVSESIVFHAGTKIEAGKVYTNGGRVLAISSFGKDMQGALDKSYANADKIQFKDKYFRKDIGFDL